MTTNLLFPLPASPAPPDMLLDVPRNRTKLDVWKERYGVWTHHAPHCPEAPWIACAARDFIKTHNVKPEDATDIGALFAVWCRIIDEHGFVEESDSEEDACYKLAIVCEWPFLESITAKDCALPATQPLNAAE